MAEVIILMGAFVMFTGAYGMFIFKDPFQRFHPTGKVGMFGLAILILGEAVAYHEKTGEWSFVSLIGILLLIFVGPFASHVLARALYRQHARRPKI